jgi:oligopeptide transport system substrate-binding protein
LASCAFDSAERPLKVGINRPISTLNYQKTSSTTDMEQMAQFMEGLLVFDEQGEVIPAGAKSWSVSDDGLVYRFLLREDARWQDGSTVVAQDYYFAWLEILRHKTSPFAYTLFPIKQAESIYQGGIVDDTFGVRVVHDFELEIVLAQPYLSFIYSIATPTMYPLKQSFYEAIGPENFGTTKERILTNGAYNIKNYDAASKLFLTKASTYWDSGNVGVPEIEVYVVQEEATRRTLFDEGNLDMMQVGADSLASYERLTDKPQIITKKTAKINYLYLSGNTLEDNRLLRNENLRQAIGYAINRITLTDNILKDGSVPLTRIVPCDFAYVGNVDYCTLGQQSETYAFNLERARALFAQAEEELVEPIHLTLVYQEAGNNALVLENLKFQLEEALIGLRVDLKAVPDAGYSSFLRESGAASAMQTWAGSFATPEVYLQILEKDSSFNFGKYNNPDFQAKYEAAMRTTDKRTQFQMYAEAEDIALQSYMFLPLYQQGVTYILSQRVRQFNYKMTLPNVYYKGLRVV